jgi:glyoxylase-like metal-dependent hydrolase (beta-lactamase superfamily II)
VVDQITLLDVNFQGEPGVVACGLVKGASGFALVDPGPASSLSGLNAALDHAGHSLADVRAILVTHIHLDHSGSAGVIVRQHPGVQVYVHERGAPHVVDPGRLLQSATRIYGDRMERLWGEVAPVPAPNVHPLKGGERLDIVGREIEAAYTPGHAMHHLSYFDIATGTAFTGDVGGMVVGRVRLVVPPTPPPDIDVELWEASVARIRAWRPRRLFITHFGFVDAPEAHFDELVARLRRLAARVRESLAVEGRDADRLAWFRRAVAADLRRQLPEADVVEIGRDVMLDDSWHGLARYWRKRDAEVG